MSRYVAYKRRSESRDRTKALLVSECDMDQEKPVEYRPNTTCTDIQTDLTMSDLLALEDDYQQRIKEVSELDANCARGFPNQKDLKDDDKMLRFYTGLSSFTILMALFKIVSVSIHESPVTKLTQFQCFILTLMKLWLNFSNYDLACRFGISEATVNRVFSRWIEAMDIRLSFLISWPDWESLWKTMPYSFRCNYSLRVTSCMHMGRCSLDCTKSSLYGLTKERATGFLFFSSAIN